LDKLNIPEGNFSCETYRNGNIIGVDTAHSYNQNQSYEQRKQDAITQIKLIIDEYEGLLEKEK